MRKIGHQHGLLVVHGHVLAEADVDGAGRRRGRVVVGQPPDTDRNDHQQRDLEVRRQPPHLGQAAADSRST
ncbi:MAG TPA: hypothetical protein VHD58_02735 [Mycobacteriales bacterium]|nr:hypothetical protein [Mycobacteriales bacterium]